MDKFATSVKIKRQKLIFTIELFYGVENASFT